MNNIESLLYNKTFITTTILFSISFLLNNMSYIPNFKKIKQIKKYVPKIYRILIAYFILITFLSFLYGYLTNMFVLNLNRNFNLDKELLSFDFYISEFISIISLVVLLFLFIKRRILLYKNDDLLYYINNMPDVLFKIIYPAFKNNYYGVTTKKKMFENEEGKMEISIDNVYIEAMRKELLEVSTKVFYEIIVICLIVLLINILFSINKSKSISLFNFLLIIPFVFSLFFIIRNSHTINSLCQEMKEHNIVKYNIIIDDDSITINNITKKTIKHIYSSDIKKIRYHNHIIVITANNKNHFIPNIGNIDYLIEKKNE